MAVDKLVDSTQLDADITSVANAIRIKGGTSGQMAFPAGFVSAVQAIPTVTTPTGTKQISITANGTTTEDVAAYASAEIAVNVSGGGGSGYTLLASGSYTHTGSPAVQISIPVTYTGKAVYAYAVADEIIAETNQSYAFIALQEDGFPFTQYLQNGKGGITSIVNTSGVISSNVINNANGITNGLLYLNRATNAYLIQPNTYNWFIYGEAAT